MYKEEPMAETNYIFETTKGAPIKAWTKGLDIEDAAHQQLRNVAALPFIYKHIAVMPDVHWGVGATVGSVIPTMGAIIPAAGGDGPQRFALAVGAVRQVLERLGAEVT